MKRLLISCTAGLLWVYPVFCQAPVGTPGNSQDWFRGGNTNVLTAANIFGTAFSSPIYTITNNTLRMKLNTTYTGFPTQYPINNATFNNGVNTSGYLLLGENTPLGSGGTLFNDKGAFSLLHLNGNYAPGQSVQELGYRPWMKVGITYTSNSDALYIGQRTMGTDITDNVITWSDNASGPIGPDVLKFIFTYGAYNAGNTNPNDPGSVNGYEVARFMPDGNVGIGQTWTTALPPQRRLEVLDATNVNNVSLNLPQFRLTYDKGNTAVTGIWTDFQTMNNGDMQVDMRFLGQNRAFEINHKAQQGTTINAVNTISLDVNGQTNLRAVPQNDNLTRVLVWNDANNGRVEWRDANTLPGGGGGNPLANNGCSIDPGNPQRVQWGNDAGQITAQLLNDREIPMNNNNAFFSDPTPANYIANENNIGIGNALPIAKLDVFRRFNNTPLVVTPEGFRVINADVSLPALFTGTAYGVHGATTGQNRNNYGGFFEATLATANYGVYGIAYGNSSNCGGRFEGREGTAPMGVAGFGSGIGTVPGAVIRGGGFAAVAGNTGQNLMGSFSQASAGGFTATNVYGSYFQASANAGNFQNVYGIYADAFPINPNLQQIPNVWAGYFNGYVFATGQFQTSDTTVKDSISPIMNATGILSQVSPIVFKYKESTSSWLTADTKDEQYGLMAQQIEQILPSLVKMATFQPRLDTNGLPVDTVTHIIKSVSYTSFVPILIQAFNEEHHRNDSLVNVIDSLQSQVTQMQNDIANLYSMIAGCCSQSQARTDQSGNNGQTLPGQQENVAEIDVELTNSYLVVLDQNVPNPFAEHTAIRFHIPNEVQEAQMLFTDMSGKVIKTLEISDRGWGRVNVYANDLSSGVYTYSLVLDGKIYDSKRMVKN